MIIRWGRIGRCFNKLIVYFKKLFVYFNFPWLYSFSVVWREMNYPGIINTRYLASRSTRVRIRHPRWEIDCCLLIYFCFAWDYLALQDNGRYRCVIVRHGNMQVHWIKFALHVHRSGWIAISHQRIIRRRPDFLASAPSHEIFARKSSWNLHESLEADHRL